MPPKYSHEIDRPIIAAENLKYQFRTSPCEAACPAGNPIQKIHSLVEKDDFDNALWYLKARNPLAGITGRVCPHPCQSECNRGRFDHSVDIQGLERSAYENADASSLPRPRKRQATGKTVAVIGGGPAGLTSAYYLGLLGHRVTVYDDGPIPGGVPRLLIPDFRLPKEIVDRETGWMQAAGFLVRMKTRIGDAISFQTLCRETDAVVIAAGTAKERQLKMEGTDTAIKAVDFLRSANLGMPKEIGKNVVIVGGGGVAFDCAFTARRLGAESVNIICLEECDRMVAPEEDQLQAEQENIVIHNACMISEIRRDKGTVSGVSFFNVSECFFDDSGKAHITAASNEKMFIRADSVIVAIGMQPDLDFLGEKIPEVTEKGTLKVDEENATTFSGVFAAGDIVSGPSSVATAIASGRNAAFGVHRYLTGETDRVFFFDDAGFVVSDDRLAGSSPPHIVGYDEIYGIYHYQKSGTPSYMPPSKEDHSRFPHIDRKEAGSEANRCFHCGHCKSCGICVEDCPGYVLEMNDREKPQVAHGEECWHCANCRTSCPCSALGFEFPLYMLV